MSLLDIVEFVIFKERCLAVCDTEDVECARHGIIPQAGIAELSDVNLDLVLRPAYVLEDDQLELPSDTLAALLLLRAQFPRTQASPRCSGGTAFN